MKFICALALVAASGSVIECQSREELAARIQASQPRATNTQVVSFVQERLTASGHYKGPMDGRMRDDLRIAVGKAIAAEPALKTRFSNVSDDEKLVACLQWFLQGETAIPLAVDGIWGGDTEAALLYVLAGE